MLIGLFSNIKNINVLKVKIMNLKKSLQSLCKPKTYMHSGCSPTCTSLWKLKIARPGRGIFLCSLFALFLAGCSSKSVSTSDSASWLVKETPNLILHYQPRSYAARNLNKAAAEYERSYRQAASIIPIDKTKPKLDVYLHDSLKAAGHANRNNRSSHYVYARRFQLTSAHEMMHHFLYEMNPNVPIRVEEGVCRLFEDRVILTSRVKLFQLAKAAPRRLLDVREVFKDGYKTDIEGNVAAAFAQFFVTKLGWQKFWAFYRRLDKRQWEVQLQRAFGKNIAAINRDFVIFVRGLKSPPAVFRM